MEGVSLAAVTEGNSYSPSCAILDQVSTLEELFDCKGCISREGFDQDTVGLYVSFVLET